MVSSQANAIIKSFQWKHNDKAYQLKLDLDTRHYSYYKSLPRGYGYAHYTREHPGHAVVDKVASAIWDLAKAHALNEWDAVNVTVAFVQHLSYQNEASCKIEHAKYPIETLLDGGGDCEDTAILLATLLKKMGYAAMLISPPGHLAVAVACANCSGTFIKKNDLKYYYVETTYPGWEIGEIPEQFNANACVVYPVHTIPNYAVRNVSGSTAANSVVSVINPRLQVEDVEPETPVLQPEINMANQDETDGLNADYIMFPSKMEIEVNGQIITAYTNGEGSVRILEGADGRIRIYSTGESLVVLE